MASVVEICNLALGHLGDPGTVSSIDPPEGSDQASHCAQFYPMARDALLNMDGWTFTTKRINPAQLTSESTMWKYAYALPSDCQTVVAVLPPNATDDYSQPSNGYMGDPLGNPSYLTLNTSYPSVYTPQPYAVETQQDGTQIVLTNQEQALIRYNVTINDTAQFSPLFVLALSYFLASMLAGPVIRGEAGIAAAEANMKMAAYYIAKAGVTDANQSRTQVRHSVSWMAAR